MSPFAARTACIVYEHNWLTKIEGRIQRSLKITKLMDDSQMLLGKDVDKPLVDDYQAHCYGTELTLTRDQAVGISIRSLGCKVYVDSRPGVRVLQANKNEESAAHLALLTLRVSHCLS